jgi:N-acetylmuramic acid 6-phosphate etherase
MSRWARLPTEAINPATRRIDSLSSAAIVARMSDEDRRVVAAVRRERGRIARGADLIADALRTGGRLIFVGAGTSGRLGVLEAAEIPPTFGTLPSVVRALIAGGRGAVFRAREGAEDDRRDGARQIAALRVGARDAVVGITASGVTPFVEGALAAAKRRRARVVLVTCSPRTAARTLVDVLIAPAVGPEVIAGSTRLKAGTATKMALNMLTTTAMIGVGKTYGNLMVDVRTGSAKLKDRAGRILGAITGLPPRQARAALIRARWNVKAAIVMTTAQVSYAQARARLRAAGGRVNRAIARHGATRDSKV